jgi:hypothetical protein
LSIAHARGGFFAFPSGDSTPAASSRSNKIAAFPKARPISSSVIPAGVDAIGGAELVDFGFLDMGHFLDKSDGLDRNLKRAPKWTQKRQRAKAR